MYSFFIIIIIGGRRVRSSSLFLFIKQFINSSLFICLFINHLFVY